MFPPRLGFFALLVVLKDTSVSAQDCECGVGNEEQIVFRIINGQEAFPHAYPWLVYLAFAQQMYCGGSIINDRYILTAGHCVYKMDVTTIIVYVGAHDLNTNKGTPMKVDIIKMHPDFTRYSDYDDNDIALLRLQQRITFTNAVRPICLPVADNYDKEVATIAGWGITESKLTSKMLLFSKLRIMSDEVCSRSSIIGPKYRPQENICAYGYKTDSCQGDSGSPLIHEVRPYKYQVLGVVSWGHGCAPMGIPGIYANVVHYVPWILNSTLDARYCKK